MMAEETFPIEEFKGLLLTLLKNKFDICDNFITRFNSCETVEQLVSLFELYKDEVYSELGGDISEIDWLSDEVDDLKDEVRDLENEKDELESELAYARLNFGDTLDDVYKIAAFKEYYNEYTPWQLEELLKNGKKFLKIKSFDNWMEDLKLIAFKFSPREYPLESKWDLDFWKETYYDKKLTPQETWDVYTTMIY